MTISSANRFPMYTVLLKTIVTERQSFNSLLRLIWISLSFVAIFGENCQGATGDVLSTDISTSGRMIEKVEWQGTEKEFILISYPKELKKSHTYHLNFWFPGTSGNPGPGIAAENESYIEVCLSYLAKNDLAVGEYASAHWALCRKVEEHLLSRKSISVGQRIVSGVSKGGWLGFQMSLVPPQTLNGIVIVAAGIMPREKGIPNHKQSKLSVLVCTGETDVNYPFAQMAEAYYQKSGLKDYSYEEWLTFGHVSHISIRTNEWLNVMTKKNESKDDLQKYCESIINQRMLECDKVIDPKDKYIFLRHCLKSPASAHIGSALREDLLAKGRELGKEGAVVAWLGDYAILRKIVQAEVKIFSEPSVASGKIADLKSHFLKLSETTHSSDIKIRAAYGYLRNTKAYASLLIQENERASPEFKKLESQLLELRNQINLKNPPDPHLLRQFQQMASDLGSRTTEIAMNAFYQIEWHGKYTVEDAQIKNLLEEGKKSSTQWKAYSGLFY